MGKLAIKNKENTGHDWEPLKKSKRASVLQEPRASEEIPLTVVGFDITAPTHQEKR